MQRSAAASRLTHYVACADNCYAHSEPVNAASIGKGPKFILATGGRCSAWCSPWFHGDLAGDDKVVNIWTLGKDKPLLVRDILQGALILKSDWCLADADAHR